MIRHFRGQVPVSGLNNSVLNLTKSPSLYSDFRYSLPFCVPIPSPRVNYLPSPECPVLLLSSNWLTLSLDGAFSRSFFLQKQRVLKSLSPPLPPSFSQNLFLVLILTGKKSQGLKASISYVTNIQVVPRDTCLIIDWPVQQNRCLVSGLCGRDLAGSLGRGH